MAMEKEESETEKESGETVGTGGQAEPEQGACGPRGAI